MPSQPTTRIRSSQVLALRQGQAQPQPAALVVSARVAGLQTSSASSLRAVSTVATSLQRSNRLYNCQPDATRVKSGLPLASLFARRGYRTLYGGVLLDEVVISGHASAGQPDILDSPLGNAVINSPFAKIRGGKPHPGTDYKVPGGTPYHATAKGKVVKAGFSKTYGNVIIIDHGPGYNGSAHVYTIYAHASKLLVRQGQLVAVNDVVSLSGNTGHVVPPPPKGYHGHYEVIQTNAPFGSWDFYAFKYKHKATDLRKLLRGE
ncbi:M23 family metallopeptidase [Hymenobacter terrenus]|uniref:M23 family metallopeptidase n=1 Tax=Hymenobacter terrenus TaxID=1629124 RepID=UPI000696B9E0|nr:M23 family metallopeptidase [Hymenobacter terrenus]